MMPAVADLAAWHAGMLLHATWIAAVAALLAWILLRGLRDPRHVHAVAAGGLLLIGAGLLAAGLATWPQARQPIAPAGGMAADLGRPATAPLASAMVPAAPAAAPAGSPPSWHGWLAGLWCCGALGMALRHAGAWWFALRLRQEAVAVEGALGARFLALCRQARIPPPLLLASPRLAVPVAMGWWRPAVLVPASLLSGLQPPLLEALILHELAHLRRRDWLVEIAVSLLQSLLFFHPAVWWLAGRLRQAREQCCDGQAVSAGAGADHLARALLALAERTAPRNPLLAATGGRLAERVGRILGMPTPRERSWPALAAIVPLPLLAILLAACATTSRLPRTPGEPLDASLLAAAGPARPLPLDRRIRARADGRTVLFSARMIEAPASFWSEQGCAGDAPVLLDRDRASRVLAAADAGGTAHALLPSATITAPALEPASASFISQFAWIADYRLLDGRPDPILQTLSTGRSLQLRGEPAADGVVLVDARAIDVEMLGCEEASFPWTADGAEQRYPLELPVVLIREGQAAPDTRLGNGEALAIPLRCRVQRGTPTFRHALEHGRATRCIPDPDPAGSARRVCLITAATGGAATCRLDAAPGAAAWLDSTRIHLELRDAPLEEAVAALAAQLPVRVDAVRDDDFAHTRVTVAAQGDPARTVIARLLGQCLLDGRATADLLRLAPATGPAAAGP